MIVLTSGGEKFDLLNPEPNLASNHPNNQTPASTSSSDPHKLPADSKSEVPPAEPQESSDLAPPSTHSHSNHCPSTAQVAEPPPNAEQKTNQGADGRPARPKSHACKFEGCGKSFYTQHDLTVHTRTHTGERPYHCAFSGCGKSFSQNSGLIRHHRVHTGDRPFACRFCGRRFSESCHRTRHESMSCQQRRQKTQTHAPHFTQSQKK
eukprot:c3733_g1_i1.p1 GENE.c3733_g1_i1~~c3733_g1_i1.p1  ORF type:complete len:218 (+),score=13.95 c3733_g1_i1:34-654(+)